MPCYQATAVEAMAFAAITSSSGIIGTIPSVSAFAPPSNPTTIHHTNRRLPAPLHLADDDPLSDMTNEPPNRKPLLACMTKMNDSDDEQRACPVSALLHLPKLKRFSISPVGKGVGPALLI